MILTSAPRALMELEGLNVRAQTCKGVVCHAAAMRLAKPSDGRNAVLTLRKRGAIERGHSWYTAGNILAANGGAAVHARVGAGVRAAARR